TPAALLPLAVAGVALFVVAHAELTGNLLGFLPEAMRQRVEAAFGVPPAAPGEGTHWRVGGVTPVLRAGNPDGAGGPGWGGGGGARGWSICGWGSAWPRSREC